MRKGIIIILFFIASDFQAQIVNGRGIELRTEQFSNWTDENSEYSGIYRFGESEWESELLIIQTAEFIVGQLKFSNIILDKDNQFIRFSSAYQNLDNCKIKKHSLESNRFKGEFKYFKENQNLIPGLILFQSPNNLIDKNEFGFKKNVELENYFHGDYPFASIIILDRESLLSYDLKELKIMRNEIFARYGYEFREGGEMYNYFHSKDWYCPDKRDVNKLLTEIEKRNIETINELEAEKK